MVAMDNGFFFITVFVVASLIQVNALQCWTCSSQTELHTEFCGKKFLENKIPEKLEKIGSLYRNCSAELGINKKHHNTDEIQNLIPVCRKKVIKVNDETFYQRHCDFVDKRAKGSICKREKLSNNEELIDCEDCVFDYCNKSIGILPYLLHFVTPILLGKILLY